MNANIAAGRILPMCQDTGTAIIMGKKGDRVFTGASDEKALSKGVFDTYQTSNLRYSQMAPLTMYEEVLKSQFLAMETAMAKYSSTQSYLEMQAAQQAKKK